MGVRGYLGLLIEEGVERVGRNTLEWCALLTWLTMEVQVALLVKKVQWPYIYV